MKRTLVIILACCAAGIARAGEEATPEDIAYYNEWRQKKQALADLDEYARAAVAVDTNAALGDRFDAIRSLTNNPSAHLDALELLMNDPDWALRYAAIEAIEPVRTDLAYTAAKQMVLEAAPATNTLHPRLPWSLYSAELMARLGDGSAMPFIVQQLLAHPFCSTRGTAINALHSFYYMKELKPYEPLVRFIDHTLPDLNSPDAEKQRDALSLLPHAISMLSQLNAVEALPAFSRWASIPVPDEIRHGFESAQRELEALKTRLENGEPDPRDNPEFKRIPGVTPAWRFPKFYYDM